MDQNFAQDAYNMLDFEGRIIERKHQMKLELVAFESSEYECKISSVSVLAEDERLTAMISFSSVNDETVQKPPENKYNMDDSALEVLRCQQDIASICFR